MYVCMYAYMYVCINVHVYMVWRLFWVFFLRHFRKFEVSARTMYLAYVQVICVAHGAKGWDQMHHMHGAKADLIYLLYLLSLLIYYYLLLRVHFLLLLSIYCCRCF